MDHLFGTDWNSLTPELRVKRCHALAAAAQKEAAEAPAQEKYLKVAQGWLELASEIEKENPH
jgi:hypothetical protein